MKYNNICTGRFISRPNRFIANVDIDGQNTVCHVKNTGRCRELLTDGALCYLEKSDNPARKTAYDLVAVEKNGRLVNMDSQVCNRVVEEWLRKGELFGENAFIKPEFTYGKSRFDFYIESNKTDSKTFLEVKGVTLEENGVVMFPDAPTERGVKHIEELIKAKENGYDAYIFFLVQMSDVEYFTPNKKTHPEFAQALEKAQSRGVNILVYDSLCTADSIVIGKPVRLVL